MGAGISETRRSAAERPPWPTRRQAISRADSRDPADGDPGPSWAPRRHSHPRTTRIPRTRTPGLPNLLERAEARDERARVRDRAALMRDRAARRARSWRPRWPTSRPPGETASMRSAAPSPARAAAGQRDRAARHRREAAEQRPPPPRSVTAAAARSRSGSARAAAARSPTARRSSPRSATSTSFETTRCAISAAPRSWRARCSAACRRRGCPRIAGIDVAVHYEPSAPEEVGGDFYDLFPLAPGRSGFFLGDVGGKGPEAASVTSLARYTMRTAAMLHERPDAILMDLNAALLMDERRADADLHGGLRGDRHRRRRHDHRWPWRGTRRRWSSARTAPSRSRRRTARCSASSMTRSSRSAGSSLAPGDAIVIYSDGIHRHRDRRHPARRGARRGAAGGDAPARAPGARRPPHARGARQRPPAARRRRDPGAAPRPRAARALTAQLSARRTSARRRGRAARPGRGCRGRAWTAAARRGP